MTLLRSIRIPLALFGLVAAPVVLPSLAFANHAVYVEGEEDFDRDGRIGAAEDTDGDAIFGKINTALAAAAGGLNQNGKAIIVTSGRFLETVSITGPVTLEAAPGVEADIEAFLSPAVDATRLADFDTPTINNTTRQSAPGIVVNVPVSPGGLAGMPQVPGLAGTNDRPVVLRNLTIRNWTDGVTVVNGQVLIDNVRIEHNIQHGVNVLNNSQVAIVNTSVAASGFRVNPNTGDFPRGVQGIGVGVRFRNTSTGDISRSSLTNNFNSGLSIETPRVRDVTIRDVQFFANNTTNPNAAALLNSCRMSSGRNFDEGDVCFQAVQRIVLGIPEQP